MLLKFSGPASNRPLRDIVPGRSGDKGGNVNCRLYIQSAEQGEWSRSFMTRDGIKKLMKKDWRDWYLVERVEFHFFL